MNKGSFDLSAMLAELRNARALAEQEARDLREEEREIEGLRAAALAAIRKVKERSSPRAMSAQRLEEAVNRINSTQCLSAAAGLSGCARAAESLEPVVAQADDNRSVADASEAARRLRDFAQNFAAARKLAQAAAKNNGDALASLRQIRAAVALM